MAIDVTSFAWHVTQPGLMAAVALHPGGDPRITTANLVTLDFQADLDGGAAAMVVARVSVGHSIVWWGERGFLLRHYDETLEEDVISFLDLDGDQVWQRQAGLTSVSSAGDVLLGRYLDDGTLELRRLRPNASDAEPGELLELPQQDVTAVAWSTNGHQVAVNVYEGGPIDWRLDLYNLDGGLEDSVSFQWRVWDVRWSPDDRYVLMPGTDNRGTHVVLFYDTHTGELTTIQFDEFVQWAQVQQ